MEAKTMVATVAKWGNSFAIRIPQNLAKELQVVEGSEISLTLVDGALVMKPRKSRKRYSLDELIKEITPENLHAEIDSGIAVGNEVW
jgi:antitoxin MazE